MASMRATRTAAKKGTKKQTSRLIPFHWEGGQYTLDLQRNKVYQNWMAVETNKGCAILGAYRQATVSV